MDDGSIQLAMVAALLFLGGLVVERLVLTWQRPAAYFAVGLSLLDEPVPIPAAPEGEGQTATVAWRAGADRVLFWAPVGARQAPMGLHGRVDLEPTTRGVHLRVRWAPPWSPLLAAMWLVGLGVARGEAYLTAPIGTIIVVGVLLLYRQVARRAAAELRWAWVRGDDPEVQG